MSKQSGLIGVKATFASIVAAILAISSVAHAAPPTADLVSGPIVSPSGGWSSAGTARSTGAVASALPGTPADILALARTLGMNRLSAVDYSQNVYEYVHNNIEVEFRFGLGKGARGALIDQSGTPFDQADLMVQLLRVAGVSATYKVGTITLNAQQFGQWSGLVSSLNEADQSVTVDATAACQFIADGGIPVSCSPSSGQLTSITMAHVWVSANGLLYDPAFKTYKLYNGIDVPAAMGCGTASASTCGNLAATAAMSGAVQGTTTGLPSIKSVNEISLGNQLTSFSRSLKSQIQTVNRIARTEQIVSGKRLDGTIAPSVGASLSYASEQTGWTDVPDAYRTKLRVRIVFDAAPSGLDRNFFVDELSGHRLQLRVGANLFAVDGVELQDSQASCATCAGFSPYTVVLDVDHPYPSTSYADSHVELAMWTGSTDQNTISRGTFPVTIIYGVGNTTESTVRYVSAWQESHPTTYRDNYLVNTPYTNVTAAYSSNDQPILGAKLLSQGALADRIISGLSRVSISRHHDIGIVFAHPGNPSATSMMSIVSAISVDSTSSDSTARTKAFNAAAATWAMLEGSVHQQANNADTGISTANLFRLDNQQGYAFLDMTAANVLAGLPSSIPTGDTAYRSRLTQAASAGYGMIISEHGGEEILSKANSLGYTVGAAIKGGSAVSKSLVTMTLDSTKLADEAAERKKYLSVSPADGAATLTETDLTTGAGEFPASLPFRRTYHSGTSITEFVQETRSDRENSDSITSTSISYNYRYSGPDTNANARIGGGWTHNYNVIASWMGNGAKGLGADYAMEGLAGIVALQTIMDATAASAFSSRLTGVFASHWLARQLSLNSVVIDKGGSSETFHQLPTWPDADSYFTASGSSQLLRTNSPTVDMDFSSVYFDYTGQGGDTIHFNEALENHVYTTYGRVKGEPVFKATTWTFPTGDVVTFDYQPAYLETSYANVDDLSCSTQSGTCSGSPSATHLYGSVLSAVSNNRGRRLTFATASNTVKEIAADDKSYVDMTSTFTIKSVTDESGRTVQYDLSGCPTLYSESQSHGSARFACTTLVVTSPDGNKAKYDYTATVAPDALKPTYRLRKWYTPSDFTTPYRTLNYDDLLRVTSTVDPLSNPTFYYPGSVVGTEHWKRSEVVSALGSVSTTIFDEHNSATKVIDALGRSMLMSYDNAGRKVRTEMPEHNVETVAYDVRGNVTGTCKIPKERAGQSCDSTLGDITTSATYMEAATVYPCSNWKTCNQPKNETDPKGKATTYTYSSSTGQLLTVSKPAVTLLLADGVTTASVAPLTTLCYTTVTANLSSGSLSLLTGKIAKVNQTSNRVESYAYDSAKKYVLQSGTVDPSTTLTPPSSSSLSCPTASKANALNLTTTLAFDGIGNVTSVDGPVAGPADTTIYTFDKARRITRINAPLGATTRYCYDADGLVRSSNRTRNAGVPDPNATAATIDGTCPNGFANSDWQSETREYWETGDLKRVTDAEGNVTSYAYDDDGQQRVVQDPDGRQVATVYDLAGEIVQTWKGGMRDADPQSTTTWLDASGKVSANAPVSPMIPPPSALLPSNPPVDSWSPSIYASRGYVGALRYAAYVYSLNGKKRSVTDADNNTTVYDYDGFDRLTFTYFPDPNDGYRCSANAPITSSSTPTCTNKQTYEKSVYDKNGNVTSFRTRGNNTITSAFDAINRVTSKTVSGTPALGKVSYYYNLVSEPMLISSPVSGTIAAHSTAYDYDGAGRKLFEKNLLGFSATPQQVSYAYDAAGNRQQTTWPDGYYLYYTYDALNRMQYVFENSTSANELAFYKYDTLSRRSYVCLGGQGALCQTNSDTGGTNRINYSYEPDSNLDLLTNVLNTATVSLDYGHNRSGQIRSIASNDDFYLPGPVTSTPVQGGSPISVPTAYTPNKLNQYSSLTMAGAANAPTYSNNGNLLTWGPTASKHTYTYDSESRLRTAAVTGGSSTTYDYDVLGRRISKVVDTTNTTYYLLDGDEEIAEYDSAGVMQRRYLMGPAIDDRIAMQRDSSTSTPTKTFYHVNHQGSVIAMTDASGNANCSTGCQTLSYDEYGNLGSASVATGQPYRYTGRRFDPETGLYYYRARYYSPQLGRFLQTDPVGYKADPNLYTYVGDDPANTTDADGECPWCVVGAVVSGGIQFYLEQKQAGGWRNIDSDGVKRILISGAAGALGGGAATLTARLTSSVARVIVGAGAGAGINTAQSQASAKIVEGRDATPAELKSAAAWGAATSTFGGVLGESLGSGGPAVTTVARNAPADVSRAANEINWTTRSAYTDAELKAVKAGQTLGNALGVIIDGVANSTARDPAPPRKPECHVDFYTQRCN